MHLSEVTTALPCAEAAGLHLSEVTTVLPLFEAASLHLNSLAQLMLSFLCFKKLLLVF